MAHVVRGMRHYFGSRAAAFLRNTAPSTAAAAAAAAGTQQPPSARLQQLRPPVVRFGTAATASAGQPTSAISTRNNDPEVTSTQVLANERQVEVLWDDGHNSYFDYTWLRVNCPSFLHESGQRTVFPGDVDPRLKPVETSAGDSRVSITWSDGHLSLYGTAWLREHDNSPSALHERSHGSRPVPLCAWDVIPKVDARDYMEDDGELYKALRKINRVGVVLLENAGVEEGAVLDLARRVAPVSHHTLYGDMFDVVSQANPRNMAYTNERLRMHMDLVYYESPPGLQFLHCLEFDEGGKGGQTSFLDAFAAADHFREKFPEKFEVLSRVPTTFEKVRAAAPRVDGEGRNVQALEPSHMKYQRPIFQLDANGELLAVTWAPMFEGVLMCQAKDVVPYYLAHREFQRLVEEGPYAESHTVRQRLNPGQCLVFNNRRMLHGREAFTMSEKGSRWLQGCYVNIDDATSRLCSLHVSRPSSSSSSSPESGTDDGSAAPDYLTRVGNGSLPVSW